MLECNDQNLLYINDHLALILLLMEHQNFPFQCCLNNLKVEQSVHVTIPHCNLHVCYIHMGMTAVCSPKSLSKSLIHTTNIQLTEQQIALTMARASQGVTLELVRLLPTRALVVRTKQS